MGDTYNPKDRLKSQLRRKSSSRINLIAPSVAPVDFRNLENVGSESCPTPSINPFKIASPQKKRSRCQVTFQEDLENAQDSFGAHILKTTEPPKTPTRTSPRKRKSAQIERYKSFDPNLLQEFHAVDFSQLLATSSTSFSSSFNTSSQTTLKQVQEESDDVPLDLRLGGKLRVISKVPFPWMSTRKSTGIVAVRIPANDRYEGLKYFNKIFLNGQEETNIPPPQSVLSLLESACLYHQFPVIPGLTLYPRITSEIRNMTRIPLAPVSTSTMFNQWVECYEQLFMSYKKGERDSFYVASAVFNVLFTKTAVSDENGDVPAGGEESQSGFRSFSGQTMVALVSHTTSATREHLRNQGVDYEVIGAAQKQSIMKRSCSFNLLSSPSASTLDGLWPSESKENSSSGLLPINENSIEKVENPEKSIGESENVGDDSSDENDSPTKANQQWLKDIGVSPRHIKGNVRRKLSYHTTDREAGGISCLLIKGSAVQSLYNTLMSSDIVHEKTGPYTKIPPTLIATSPFLYGQTLSLNKTSQIISKAGTKGAEYVLEIDGGAVLPHCAKMIAKFVRSARLCPDEDKAVTLQVSEKHSNHGMSDWTKRTTNWNSLTITEQCVKWNKN